MRSVLYIGVGAVFFNGFCFECGKGVSRGSTVPGAHIKFLSNVN